MLLFAELMAFFAKNDAIPLYTYNTNDTTKPH